MPDTTLPRPIEPGEIRVGDKVRALRGDCDGFEARSWTFRVAGIVARTGKPISFIHRGGMHFQAALDISWTLLDRPTPAPAVGSRWADDEGDEFVVTEGGSHFCYRGQRAGNYYRSPSFRLTPISDHGDGCSPWLWDKETRTAWVASCGFPVTHVQVAGTHYRSGYLNDVREDREIARRLRPWSERGQANG